MSVISVGLHRPFRGGPPTTVRRFGPGGCFLAGLAGEASERGDELLREMPNKLEEQRRLVHHEAERRTDSARRGPFGRHGAVVWTLARLAMWRPTPCPTLGGNGVEPICCPVDPAHCSVDGSFENLVPHGRQQLLAGGPQRRGAGGAGVGVSLCAAVAADGGRRHRSPFR
jgi:hypothetical protein